MEKSKQPLSKTVTIKQLFIFISFILFIAISYFFNFKFGELVYKNFYTFSKSMLSFVPAVFILIGIFDVWIKKEHIVRHMGKDSGLRGYFWAVILSSIAVGGIFVAFPIAYSLQQKGAKLSVIFSYIGLASVARLPMTLYEASYLGIKFSLIRLVVAIPLIIISSIILEKILEKSNFIIRNVEKSKI